jgi:hypothetical protein
MNRVVFFRVRGCYNPVRFDPAGKAWIVGDAGIIEGTIESGTLRTIAFTASSRALNSVACDNTQQVWAVGDGGLIMRHQGQQWQSTAYDSVMDFRNGLARVWSGDYTGYIDKAGNYVWRAKWRL